MSDLAKVLALPARARPPDELERQLLGAVLESPGPLALIEASGLAREDFSTQLHGFMWAVARSLAQARRPVNAATVFERLRSSRIATEAEREYVMGLQAACLFDEATARHLAEELRRSVRGRAIAQQLRAEAVDIEGQGLNPARTSGRLEGLVQTLARDHSPDDSAATDMRDGLDSWERMRAEARSAFVPTGVKLLDDELGGYPPTLTVIMADPGGGKTALVTSSILAQLMRTGSAAGLRADFRVGVFGLDDGTAFLWRRWAAARLGIPLRRLGEQPSAELLERAHAVCAELDPHLQRVTTYRHDKITRDELLRRLRKWIYIDGIGIAYIDTLLQVDHRSRGGVREDAWNEHLETLTRLRRLAIETQVPIVATVHTTEDGSGGGRGPPKMSGAAGGRANDRIARLVLGLWQHRQYAWRCTVLKATEQGEKGTTIEFKRIPEAALIDPDGGRLVDLEAEKKEAKAEVDDANADRTIRRRGLIAEKTAAAKAQRQQPEPLAQGALPLGEEQKR